MLYCRTEGTYGSGDEVKRRPRYAGKDGANSSDQQGHADTHLRRSDDDALVRREHKWLELRPDDDQRARVLVLVISSVVLLLRRPERATLADAAHVSDSTPDQLLAERSARGEIDQQECINRLDTLRHRVSS